MVGLLPMFQVDSLLVGRVLVSIPYATYGGIIADDDQAARALLSAATDIARQRSVRYVELRHREPNDFDLPRIERYDTFRKALPDDPEAILPSLPRKARAAARKGLSLTQVEFGPHLLDAIYDLYALNLRRLGSPNFRKSLFEALAAEYGDDCVCLVVRHQGRAVAGVVSYVFRDEIVPYFSGATPQAGALCANNAMYLRLMEYAVRRGLRWFDFNRTRRDNTGPHAFKRHQGFAPSPLHYQIILNRADELPNLSPSNKKYALAGRVWSKLPLWFTRAAGAQITKWIP